MFRILLLAPSHVFEMFDNVLHGTATPWEIIHCETLPDGLNTLAKHRVDAVFFHNDLGEHTAKDFLIQPMIKRVSASLVFIAPENDHHLGEMALDHGASSYRQLSSLNSASNIEQVIRTAIKTRDNYLALQESRQLYEIILQDQTELIARVDLKRGMLFANDAFCAYYGKTRKELYGHQITDQYIHTADVEQVEQKYAALTPKQPVFHNINRLVINGDTRWTEWIVRGIFDENGQLYAYQSVGRDITQQKHIQDQLKQQAQMLQQIHDAIIITDSNFVITGWNRGAENIYGYSADKVIGKRISEVLKGEVIGMSMEESMDILFSQGVWQGEARQQRIDGEWVWLHSSVNQLRDGDGKVVGFLAINTDITKQKEVDLHQQALEAERYRARLLKSLLGDLTHDLLTPITTLKTSLYLVGKALDTEKRDKHLARSEEQVEKLERILQNMMTMKRLDVTTTESRLALTRYDLNQILKDVFYNFAERPHEVRWELAESLPLVLVDPHQISLAFNEVLMNAFNYTPDGGTITIKTERDLNTVKVEIRDNGIGIDPQDLPRIFERFFRADKARNTERGGAGLGLAMAKKIVDMHGGEITVESIPSQGSIFRLIIPM